MPLISADWAIDRVGFQRFVQSVPQMSSYPNTHHPSCLRLFLMYVSPPLSEALTPTKTRRLAQLICAVRSMYRTRLHRFHVRHHPVSDFEFRQGPQHRIKRSKVDSMIIRRICVTYTDIDSACRGWCIYSGNLWVRLYLREVSAFHLIKCASAQPEYSKMPNPATFSFTTTGTCRTLSAQFV